MAATFNAEDPPSDLVLMGREASLAEFGMGGQEARQAEAEGFDAPIALGADICTKEEVSCIYGL